MVSLVVVAAVVDSFVVPEVVVVPEVSEDDPEVSVDPSDAEASVEVVADVSAGSEDVSDVSAGSEEELSEGS